MSRGHLLASLRVELGERSYPIEIGSGTIASAGERMVALGFRRAVVVSNPTIARHHLAGLQQSLIASGVETGSVMVPDGETHKNLPTVERLLTRLLELRAERSTCLVALGGGVVGDIAGFAAAVYQRGIPYVQVPTTLLAQVDSSVGGKTGVNHPLGKNMIGAFHQPRAVFVDLACLNTLPAREFAAGIAEVVKYGAIADIRFFEWIEANIEAILARDARALAHAVGESCRIKAAIVASDERESGARALLNFGHTFGHAIESATGYGAWLHGEAVAAGMVIASRVSERVLGLDPAATQRLAGVLAAARLPTEPPPIDFERWTDLMARDKKVQAGNVRFVLLDALGHACVTDAVPAQTLRPILT